MRDLGFGRLLTWLYNTVQQYGADRLSRGVAWRALLPATAAAYGITLSNVWSIKVTEPRLKVR